MLLGRLLGLEMMRNNVTRALVRQSVLEAKKMIVTKCLMTEPQ
jgi:hypothetical protein